jgi:hypothetical protein
MHDIERLTLALVVADSRPLLCLIFRGSIPHPMQSLCTLRDHCRQWPRNTRYQAANSFYAIGVAHRDALTEQFTRIDLIVGEVVSPCQLGSVHTWARRRSKLCLRLAACNSSWGWTGG